MHIADGILSWQVLTGGAALSAAGVALGLAKLRNEDLPKAACATSAFFVASLIHVPVGPSNAHLLLAGLTGLLLGVAAFPALLIALLLQFVLFQFGGILSLGVNVFDMAMPAALVGALLRGRLAGAKSAFATGFWGFAAGFVGVFLAAGFTSSALLLSGGDFRRGGLLLFAAHVPVMIVEGIATAFVALALKKTRPELFSGSFFEAELKAETR